MLSLKPQNVSPSCWYYEEKKGINVVYEIRDKNGNYIRTDQFIIPWSKIFKSVERKKSESTT